MSTLSLYEHLMGCQFARLPAAVQRFHRLSGPHLLHGWVETHAPATLLARPETPYDTLIQLMDVVREVPAHGSTKSVPLFPEISIGDSPIASKA